MFKKNINQIYSSRSKYYIIHDNRATNYISLEFYTKPNCLKSSWHVNVQLLIVLVLFKNGNLLMSFQTCIDFHYPVEQVGYFK